MAGAYLLPEVDGYVGDTQGHQEPDQGPVVRERREFHHSPRRGLTPHTSAAARGLCREDDLCLLSPAISAYSAP